MVSCIRHRFLLVLFLFAGVLLFTVSLGEYYYYLDEHHHYLYVNTSKIIFTTDDEFLSVALDTSFFRCSFFRLNESERSLLEKLAFLLTPAYLRIGGTQADQVLFQANASSRKSTSNELKGSLCKEYLKEENFKQEDYIIISGEDWSQIQNFIEKSQLKLIFDLNVLLRNGTEWDSTNAELLIDFSEKQQYPMDFQLGNEPNSFKHVFNVSISGEQLGKDFQKLHDILIASHFYNNSKLIGPDVTRPKNLFNNLNDSSVKYLRDFLINSKGDLDAVSWHQYYLNGRIAVLEDFVNPNTLDVLSLQISAVKKVVHHVSPGLPVWISETSSAYGGGAPGLSDRYVASFLWLDKLGLAASMGISVVIRQTLFEGNYSLIDSDLTPLPDMGNVVVFGMNLSNHTELIVTSGMKINYPIHSFVFTAENNNLTSKSVLLNGRKLHFEPEEIPRMLRTPSSVKLPLTVPPFSIVFWLFKADSRICDTV